MSEGYSIPQPLTGAEPPVLSARGTRLRPVTPADYDYLYRLATDDEVGFRWRHRGTTPSPEDFSRSLWDGVFTQFLVCEADTGRPFGLVVAYGAHPRDGYTYVAAVAESRAHSTGQMVVAFVLFIEYLFAVGNFRKLYMETNEFNLAQFGRHLDRYVDVEGRLREHEWYGDRFWDVLILSIQRDSWDKRAGRIRDYVLRDKP